MAECFFGAWTVSRKPAPCLPVVAQLRDPLEREDVRLRRFSASLNAPGLFGKFPLGLGSAAARWTGWKFREHFYDLAPGNVVFCHLLNCVLHQQPSSHQAKKTVHSRVAKSAKSNQASIRIGTPVSLACTSMTMRAPMLMRLAYRRTVIPPKPLRTPSNSTWLWILGCVGQVNWQHLPKTTGRHCPTTQQTGATHASNI